MKTIPLILALIFGASLVCGCNDDVELPLLDGGVDLKHGDAGLGKDLHAQDSAIDQQAGEDSSPDVIEDADLNDSMDIGGSKQLANL